jgi:hypothetical protein
MLADSILKDVDQQSIEIDFIRYMLHLQKACASKIYCIMLLINVLFTRSFRQRQKKGKTIETNGLLSDVK